WRAFTFPTESASSEQSRNLQLRDYATKESYKLEFRGSGSGTGRGSGGDGGSSSAAGSGADSKGGGATGQDQNL
ncbi:hypothetical protein Trydic_g605, partial [Trypoxylus dichotomus]